MNELKCPKCGGKNINQYRMMTGAIWCGDCGYRQSYKERYNPFIVNPKPEQPEPRGYYKVSELRERIAQIGIAQKLPTPAIVSILGYIDDVPVYTIPEKLSAGDETLNSIKMAVRHIERITQYERGMKPLEISSQVAEMCRAIKQEVYKIESEIGGEG